MLAGTPPAKRLAASRTFAREQFAPQHRYDGPAGAFAVRRSSKHPSPASWTISGLTESPLTLLAARSTTPAQIEVIGHGRRSCAFCAPRAHVTYQFGGGERKCVELAERAALQGLQRAC
jgi:hypothetical protein